MPAGSSKVYDIVEQVPIWGSCGELTGKEAETCTYEQLAKHVVAETKYPKKARKMGLVGKVFVEFVIDTDGSVIDVAILRGVHPLLDDEAIRVVKSFPEFIPGQQRGKPVKVRYRLPMIRAGLKEFPWVGPWKDAIKPPIFAVRFSNG